jgi:hypothetical protein
MLRVAPFWKEAAPVTYWSIVLHSRASVGQKDLDSYKKYIKMMRVELFSGAITIFLD